jgi:hypothetical protein
MNPDLIAELLKFGTKIKSDGGGLRIVGDDVLVAP